MVHPRVQVSTPLVANVWTHVAIAHTEGLLQVWFNGKVVATAKKPMPLENNGAVPLSSFSLSNGVSVQAHCS
jgi:hypothetical protein